MGRSEKIASRSFHFPFGIVLTFDSLKGHTSLLHSRPSQMNIDTFVIALGKGRLLRGEDRMVGSQGSMTSSFHCHSRSTGSRKIRQPGEGEEQFPSRVLSSVFTHQVLHSVPRLLWSGSFSRSFCGAKLTEGSS